MPHVVRVRYRDEDGKAKYARLDDSQLSDELERQLTELDAERVRLVALARSHLRKELSAAMQTLDQDEPERVGAFADWYFAYGTSYKLLQIASTAAALSAAGSALSSGSEAHNSPKAAATSAVSAAITEKYEALCLRPPLLEPALRRAFVSAAEQTHADFLLGVERVWEGAHALLQAHTEHTKPPAGRGKSPVHLPKPSFAVRGLPISLHQLSCLAILSLSLSLSQGEAMAESL